MGNTLCIFRSFPGRDGGKDPLWANEKFWKVAKKINRIANRPGAMRLESESHICIFPSDGTNRIRFTGQNYQVQSQPDASGPPKTYLFCDLKHIIAKAAEKSIGEKL